MKKIFYIFLWIFFTFFYSKSFAVLSFPDYRECESSEMICENVIWINYIFFEVIIVFISIVLLILYTLVRLIIYFSGAKKNKKYLLIPIFFTLFLTNIFSIYIYFPNLFDYFKLITIFLIFLYTLYVYFTIRLIIFLFYIYINKFWFINFLLLLLFFIFLYILFIFFNLPKILLLIIWIIILWFWLVKFNIFLFWYFFKRKKIRLDFKKIKNQFNNTIRLYFKKIKSQFNNTIKTEFKVAILVIILLFLPLYSLNITMNNGHIHGGIIYIKKSCEPKVWEKCEIPFRLIIRPN